MPLVGMGKRGDLVVFVLISRSTSELGDRTQLHHGVGYGSPGKHQAGPHPPRRGKANIGRVGQGRGPKKRIHILLGLLLSMHHPKGNREQKEEGKNSVHETSQHGRFSSWRVLAAPTLAQAYQMKSRRSPLLIRQAIQHCLVHPCALAGFEEPFGGHRLKRCTKAGQIVSKQICKLRCGVRSGRRRRASIVLRNV